MVKIDSLSILQILVEKWVGKNSPNKILSEGGGYKHHATTILKKTDFLVAVTHRNYISAEYIRDWTVLSQRPNGHCSNMNIS